MKTTHGTPLTLATEPVRTLSIPGGELTLLPKQTYCAQLTQPCDSYGFAFDPQKGKHALASSRVRDFHTHANTLAFLPAGCDVYSESMNGGEYLKVSWPQSTKTPRQDQPINGIQDATAIGAAHALRRIILQQSPVDSFEIERLVNRFTGYFHNQEETVSRTTSVFTAQKRRFIEEFIESNLSEKLTVQTLAKTCQLSEAYFARRFKNTFQRSPHEYVIERRLSKARSALQQSHQSLINVALDSGFSSHAHMSYVFQERLGTSPSRLRGRSSIN